MCLHNYSELFRNECINISLCKYLYYLIISYLVYYQSSSSLARAEEGDIVNEDQFLILQLD